MLLLLLATQTDLKVNELVSLDTFKRTLGDSQEETSGCSFDSDSQSFYPSIGL